MLRSEIESLRSPRVEFFSGTTLHFEMKVREPQGEDEEDILYVAKTNMSSKLLFVWGRGGWVLLIYTNYHT